MASLKVIRLLTFPTLVFIFPSSRNPEQTELPAVDWSYGIYEEDCLVDKVFMKHHGCVQHLVCVEEKASQFLRNYGWMFGCTTEDTQNTI